MSLVNFPLNRMTYFLYFNLLQLQFKGIKKAAKRPEPSNLQIFIFSISASQLINRYSNHCIYKVAVLP